jgi:hypothetical protein
MQPASSCSSSTPTFNVSAPRRSAQPAARYCALKNPCICIRWPYEHLLLFAVSPCYASPVLYPFTASMTDMYDIGLERDPIITIRRTYLVTALILMGLYGM